MLFFESVSGITTTGATIIADLAIYPKSILFYRQLIQWLGGMGIIVLAVAVLPMIGVGGMQLYKKEIVGPLKDAKLTPRITETAKALWLIYFVLTILCTLLFYLAGMSFFDAICHAFSTVSIGGFSTYSESFAFFDSALIEMIAISFMLICSLNFALHYLAFSQKSLKVYFKDSEATQFLFWIALIFILVFFVFSKSTSFDFEDIRVILFQVVSIATTAGFSSTDFSDWPAAVIYILFFFGGCRRLRWFGFWWNESNALATYFSASYS